MKSTSEYFGSGQVSSGTTFSSRSATERTASMASITALWTYLAPSITSSVSGWLRLAASSASTASTNSSIRAVSSSSSRVTPTELPASLSTRSHWMAAGSSIVRAIAAAVSPSMLIVVVYCSRKTS